MLSLHLMHLGVVPVAVDPLPFSDVKLTGEWGEQTLRNQEVLLSLNLSAWACHFTTTANLTACRAEASLWHTVTCRARARACRASTSPLSLPAAQYVKGPNSTFTAELGFLSAGDDVKPPETTSFDKCEAFCASNASCLGFTFQAADAVPTMPVHCYWKSVLHYTPQKRTASASAGVDTHAHKPPTLCVRKPPTWRPRGVRRRLPDARQPDQACVHAAARRDGA
jgi:hypothetical protein